MGVSGLLGVKWRRDSDERQRWKADGAQRDGTCADGVAEPEREPKHRSLSQGQVFVA